MRFWTPLAPLFLGQRYIGSEQVQEIYAANARAARRMNAVSIDMYTHFAEHGEWLPDNLHPNDADAADIARLTHELITQHGSSATPSLEVDE